MRHSYQASNAKLRQASSVLPPKGPHNRTDHGVGDADLELRRPEVLLVRMYASPRTRTYGKLHHTLAVASAASAGMMILATALHVVLCCVVLCRVASRCMSLHRTTLHYTLTILRPMSTRAPTPAPLPTSAWSSTRTLTLHYTLIIGCTCMSSVRAITWHGMARGTQA